MSTEISTRSHHREGAVASMQLACPRCEAEHHFGLSPGVAMPRECPSCGWHFLVKQGECSVDGPLSVCRVCANEEFYIQKDFNRQLGLLIVVVSFALIFLVMLLTDHRIGVYLLIGLAAVDFVAYRLLRNVTVCYLCHTIYRGFPQHADHKGFYLGSEEKHKHLRQSWLAELPEGEVRELGDIPEESEAS